MVVRLLGGDGGHVGHDLEDDPDGACGKDGREPEESGHAPEFGERRGGDEAEREGEADRGADERHGLRDDVVAHAVRNERGDGGGDGARALKRAADHDGPDRGAHGGDDAACNEEQEAGDDDGLAAETVARSAERNLQDALGEAVDAEREADEKVAVSAGQVPGIDCEDGKNEEESEHAQGENACEGDAGTLLLSRHGSGGV